MSRQLIIKGCLRRARFTLDLDLDVDLTTSSVASTDAEASA